MHITSLSVKSSIKKIKIKIKKKKKKKKEEEEEEDPTLETKTLFFVILIF
jgi:hypothetical protein